MADDLNLLCYGADIADWSCKIMFHDCTQYEDIIEIGDSEYSDDIERNVEIMENWIKNGMLFITDDSYYLDLLKYYSEDVKGTYLLTGLEILYLNCSNDSEYLGYGHDINSLPDFNTYNLKSLFSTAYVSESGCTLDYYVENYTNYIEYTFIDDMSSLYPADQLATYTAEQYKLDMKELYNNTLNIISKINEAQRDTGETRDYSGETPAKILQNTVASWYYNLRDFALVCLLVILVYIGIRIVLSSTAPEKAKYKQMIMNWVVAICILFLLHIIMIATLFITETITEALAENCTEAVVIPLPDGKVTIGDKTIKEDGQVGTTLVTNFVGYVRYLTGIFSASTSLTNGVGYFVMYIMLVVQTCMFTWVYGKRVVYMAFLTIIAPLVAITYPIDKIGDGKSQAFDMWIKEYIFNALLQPIHLLIYTVLCGASMQLMMNAPIYGIICLAFVVPAEKFIRKMFGFEKAQTPSALGGAAGAALAMSGIQKIGSMIRPDGKDDREADRPNKQERIRTVNPEAQANLKEKAKTGRETASGKNNSNIRTAKTTAPLGGGSQNTEANKPQMESVELSEEDMKKAENMKKTEEKAELQMPDVSEVQANKPQMESVELSEEDMKKAENMKKTEEKAELQIQDAPEVSETPANPAPTSTDTTPANPAPTSTDTTSANSAQKDNKKVQNPKSFTARYKRALANHMDYQSARMRETFTPKRRARRRRKIRRAVLGGALGVGAGLTMAAAKMAMGENASSVITGATAAGTAGYAIGSKGAQKIQELEKMDDVRETFRDGWYTQEELRERRDAEARRKEKEDPNTRAIVREAFPDNWKEMLYGRKVEGRENPEQSWFDYCYDYGLQDPETIVAARKYMDSDEFKKKYDKKDISEEQQRAIALTTARDWEKYGSWINDPEKWSKFEAARASQFTQSEEVQRISQEQFDSNEANRKAEYAAEMAALEEEKRNDTTYQAALRAEQEADDELTVARAQMDEELQKAMSENYEDGEELNQLKKQLMDAQASSRSDLTGKNQEISDVEADYASRISSESTILADANASQEAKAAARQRIAEMEKDKDDHLRRLRTERDDIKRQQTAIQGQIDAIKRNDIEALRERRQKQIRENHEFAQRTIRKKKQAATRARETVEKKYTDRSAELKKASEAKYKPKEDFEKRNGMAMAQQSSSDIKAFDDIAGAVKG